MTLTLRIDNYDVLPDGGPLSVTVNGTGLQVGRSTSMGWTLPDPDRHISSHHFDILAQNGAYYLVDTSTNGVFLEGSRHRIEGQHPLRHGERFQVGHYYITVDMGGGQPATPTPVQMASPPIAQGFSADAADPWAVGGAPVAPIDPTPRQARDPFADFSGDFIVSTPSHSPPPPPPQQPAPVAPPQAAPIPAAPMPLMTPPAAAPMPGMPASPPPPIPAPTPPPPEAPVAAPSPLPSGAPSNYDPVLAAFCEGAGLSPDALRDADAVALAHELGRTMRFTATELMAMLQDRASAKKFTKGGDRTMMGAAENNPLKFMPDASEAMDVMFATPRPGFMTGGKAVEAALADVRLHQMAVFAAIQPALIKLLEDIAPEAIEGETGGGLLAGTGKRKAWDTFVARWDDKVAAHDSGMLGAFLSHFAEAYAAAVKASRK